MTRVWDTESPSAVHQPAPQTGLRRRRGYPFYLMFLGFPVWWALGLSAFIWPILAVPMALALTRQRPIRVPRGFGVWVLFLLWMLGSATRLNDPTRSLPFAYRAATYGAATIIFLYVYNTSENLLSDRRIVLSLVVFWMVVTAGGFLGVVAPHFEFTSPMEKVLPGRLASNDFVHELIHPASAQISTFLGYAEARPKAPFEYTNDWGAVFALTTPFVIIGWSMLRSTTWRWLTRIFLVAAVVPVVGSLNRGLWLSLTLGLLYAGARLAARGRVRPLFGLVIGLTLVGSILLFTPLRGVIEARFAHPHSNQGRETLYLEAARSVLSSPLLGFGSPQPSVINPNLPSVGTQGQLWLVLYSHGIIGLAFYLGWYLVCFWQSRRGDPLIAFWCNVVIFIAIVQLPYYGQLPAQIQVTMTAAALSLRIRAGLRKQQLRSPSIETLA